MGAKLGKYFVLYGAHGLKLFSFIILIPLFTKIFPKSLWGQVLIVQALALWLQMVIEYGFNLSATRGMARVRNDTDALSALASGVIGAKIILAVIVIVIAFFVASFVPAFHGLGNLVFWSTLFAVVQGFNPIWYFMATDQFGKYALIDFASRASYLLLCFFLIKSQGDAYKIFGVGILTGIFTCFLGYERMYRQMKFKAPSRIESIAALRDGASLFFFMAATSIYTTLNLPILGSSQPSAVVAAYGTSDRIVRATSGLLEPLNRIVYARLSYLYKNKFEDAIKFLRTAALIVILGGLILFISFEILSPLLIKIVAPSYPEAVKYIRGLLIVVPIVAINNVLGFHVMLPLGLDKAFNTIFISVSVISALAMLVLTPRFGTYGMTLVTISTEVLACLAMLYFIRSSGVLLRKTVAR
ncbi:oligosaccharide flippase family protein [Deinococcus hopiensis]|uniref:Polysaccharide transporter, PST family n=1 Tax=Deinococcus hopiensis KR-140 TaxID=695939 RepID=A0A1W1VAD2_9DEIO|nr:oligosaccharide flippase family protein [Deinococcus hopiensis]SMB90160.1 polysaccharide transporter, PST family [Deinococcus hopiensis KR-140]